MDTTEQASQDLIAWLNENTSALESCKNSAFLLEGIEVNMNLLKSSFEELSLKPALIEIMYSLHIEKASIVQSMSIPLICSKNNLIAQSVAGTGKTLAYVLGVLNNLEKYDRLQVLVITPTKELNAQISSLFNQILQPLDALCVNLTASSQNLEEKEPCVIVGTPPAVVYAFSKYKTDNISHMVIDEADYTLQNFMAPVSRLFTLLSNDTQFVCFSASYPPEVLKFLRILLKKSNKQTKELLEEQRKQAEVLQFNIQAPRSKLDTLRSLLEFLNTSQLIIFCNTKKTCDYLTSTLQRELHSVSKIHGGMELCDRENALKGFRNVETKILVTTDVFSRGMDIPLVNLVINYDLPITYEDSKPNVETYQHRIGRTARFGRKGFVIDMIASEKDFDVLVQIILALGTETRMIDLQAIERAYINSLDID